MFLLYFGKKRIYNEDMEKEMRIYYAEKLAELMTSDEKIVVVDADLGKALGTQDFKNRFSGRAVDVGIAEQNMIGVAAGLASYGYLPVCQSFAPFITRNVCDQITMNLRFTGLKSLLVGADPGISAELNGSSHMAMEDISVMRAIPGMQVFEPADGVELSAALPELIYSPNTVYMRMYRKTLPAVHSANYRFEYGKIDVLKGGKDVAIFSSGVFVHAATEAAKALSEKGIDAAVVNVHTIKPLDKEGIAAVLRGVKAAIVYENHNEIGGLYSAVAEVQAAAGIPVRTVPLAIRDRFGVRGKLAEIMEELDLTPAKVVETAEKLLDQFVD